MLESSVGSSIITSASRLRQLWKKIAVNSLPKHPESMVNDCSILKWIRHNPSETDISDPKIYKTSVKIYLPI